MIFSLITLYNIFIREDNNSKPAPVYHKTWKDELPEAPASKYAKSLETVVH